MFGMEDWLAVLRRKYSHPSEVRAQMRAARQGMNAAEASLLASFPPPDQRALVIGCGAGREVLHLAAAGWEVTGVELAAGPLVACRTSLGERSLSAELILLEAPLPLPFGGAAFGAVLLFSQLLEHLIEEEQRRDLLRETARVLVAGGMVYLSTHDVRRSDLEETALLSPEPARPSDIAAGCISGARSPGDLRMHLYARTEIFADLEAAGFAPQAWLTQQEPGGGHPVWRRFLYMAAVKRQ